MSAVLKSDKLRELRVLIVDDNPGDRILYKQLLEESDPGTDYTFFEADSGQAAMARIREGQLDCVLLDYLLPDMVGLDVLKAMAADTTVSRAPTIMLTGFGDEATAVNALLGGAHGYVPKRDLSGEKLNQAIDRAIKEHKCQLAMEQSRREMASKNQDLESKYQRIESFYQQVLGKFKKPVLALRDHVTELTAEGTRPVNGALQSHLMDLRRESERLVTTLQNLMDNPGLDMGQLLISTRPESLVEVVSAVVNNFRPVADGKLVRLSVRIEPGLPEVQMDRYRIEQVLGNLLDNAIKFTPPYGRVLLTADHAPETPDAVTISVIDTGRGIDPEKLANLFACKPHTMLTGCEEELAMGLGLKVCKEIVQLHEGRITAKSLPAAGTSLTFTLPLDSRKTSSAEIWQHVSRDKGAAQRYRHA